ncbi:MAG: hypothetical protein ACE15E_12145 [Acidobacteriota bacterium]
MMRITKKAAWASSVLLSLYTGCKGFSFSRKASQDRGTNEAKIRSTTHYLSGQVVFLEREASLLRVREAVELHQPEVKNLRLTPSTIVLKGNHSGTIDQIQRGDYVLIRYSVEPDGSSNADEIRLVSKLETEPLLP